jgi:simple sugar transport system permease protein
MTSGLMTQLSHTIVRYLSGLGRALSAIVLSVLIGSVIIYLQGDNPLIAYGALLEEGLGSPEAIASTLAKATPLILTGLCAAIAFRAAVINIGGEGQLYMGAIATALVGVYVIGLPAWLHVPLALLAGAAAGFIWAAPFQWFRVRFGANELVTTTLANYIAILFTTYLVNYPFMKAGAPLGMTYNVEATAFLPRLVERGRLNVGFLIAAGLCVLMWWVLYRSSLGYEWRMIGANLRFGRYIGIAVGRRQILAMGVAGALAGLGGAIEVLGVQHRFIQDISPGWGFDGILVALMAGLDPIGVLLVALLFGLLKSGGLGMEAATNVPSELSQVLQSIIILLVSAQIGVVLLFNWLKRPRPEDPGGYLAVDDTPQSA